MRYLAGAGIAALLALALPVAPASAVTVPFTEDFAGGDAAWRGNTNSVGTLDFSSDGYVTEVFNFGALTPTSQGPVLFRGNATANASGGAFAGDYILNGVSEIRILVRHNAPTEMVFFARFAAFPIGFPGAIITQTAGIAAGSSFTELVFDIDPSNPDMVFEDPVSGFAGVFGGVGNVQFGVAVPASLAGDPTNYSFDLTRIEIVPEAGGLGALALSACAALGALRTRKRSLRS